MSAHSCAVLWVQVEAGKYLWLLCRSFDARRLDVQNINEAPNEQGKMALGDQQI